MKNNLFLLALATLLLASCGKDKGNNPENDNGEVQITASIDGIADGGTASAGRATVDSDGSGVFDFGDTWGLYTYTSKGEYVNSNTEYKYGETTLYWEDLSETEAVTFSAHYPRIGGEIVDPTDYLLTVGADGVPDLLVATSTKSKGEEVELVFKHMMHRLVVKLTAGEGVSDVSSARIDVAMMGKIAVNLLTGVVDYEQVDVPHHYSQEAATFDQVVVPQELTAGDAWIEITIGEDKWHYAVPADLTLNTPGNDTRLESGKCLTLELNLNKTEAKLVSSAITGWDSQGTITDDVMADMTLEALLDALKTGGTSADAPTLVTLASDVVLTAGTGSIGIPMTGSGYFKIDGGGHTMTWEENCDYFLGNVSPDDDAVYIELTNIKLVQKMQYSSAVVCIYNGKITLGEGVALDGSSNVIMAVGTKAALELGDGCELFYLANKSELVGIRNGATLVLNGGKTTAGSCIAINRTTSSAVPAPSLSVLKALTGDVHLALYLSNAFPIAQGANGYLLSQTDCDRLKVDPESYVSLYGEQMRKYGDNFELHLDPMDYQIKVRRKFVTVPTSGDIDMTAMTAAEVKAAIYDAVDAGFTALKLKGELNKLGMDGTSEGIFVGNSKITKIDLTEVTGWPDATLPVRAFLRCGALREVMLPDAVQVIGAYAFYGCSALTTVNLSKITEIAEDAFRECTALTTLTLDNVTAIGLDAFYGCTSLHTLVLPKCTRFGNYIVTGCSALTRIEVFAAGDIVHIEDGVNIEYYGVFDNRGSHTGENAFNPGKCDLVLNADKQGGGGALPTVSANRWTLSAIWKSIIFVI